MIDDEKLLDKAMNEHDFLVAVAQSCGPIIERIACAYFPGESQGELRQHLSLNEDLGSIMPIYFLNRDIHKLYKKTASTDEE